MKKIVTVVLAALLAATLLACTGCGNTQSVENIQKNGELIVYTNAEFAPFEYISGGKPVGVDIDICQKIADELGVTLTVENVDFDIIVSSVQSGKAALGAAGMTVTDERKESVDFSISYTTSTQYVITSEEFEVNNIEDLKGTQIGVQLGTTGDFTISDEINGYEDDEGNPVTGVLQDSGAEVITYPNANLAAEALKAGKISAVVIDQLPAEIIVQNNSGLHSTELLYPDGSTTTEEYAICVAKGNDSLMEVVNKVLQELLDDGTIEEYIIHHSTEAVVE